MQFYTRITEALEDKGFLVPVEEYEKTLDEGFVSENDQYASVYMYNQSQFEQFEKTGSVKGIRDVVTNKLVFDFDNKEDQELARKDTTKLLAVLASQGVKDDNIELYWSGYKGFTVTVRLDRNITPEAHSALALDFFGKSLTTLDKGVYNASRILRVPNSKHQVSNLYKVKLTPTQVKTLDVDKIKSLAAVPGGYKKAQPVKLKDELFVVKAPVVKEIKIESSLINQNQVPRHWKDYKWSILNAVSMKPGERHQGIMVIAATCRGLGYTKDITKGFLTTFDQKYAEVTKQDENPQEVANALQSVFSDGWTGGQYSIEKNAWLKDYCVRIGVKPQSTSMFIKVDSLHGAFTDFATNFDKNIIKTGIPGLDQEAIFLTSTHNGLLGKPGSGKTSMMLQWLANANSSNINSICYSLDMSRQTIYGKMLQNVSGDDFRTAVDKFRYDQNWAKKQEQNIKNRWGKVDFNFKSGITVDDIRDDIKRQEDVTGEKVKLLMIDYLECLQSKFSDPTTGSGLISNELKDLANEMEVCSILLLQSQKHSGGDISDPLLSMAKIKGSSLIEQSMSSILTLWREGYNPRTVDDDRFMSFAIVKNRFGGLWTDDFSWEGRRGIITDISNEGREHIKELRQRKVEMKAADAAKDGAWS